MQQQFDSDIHDTSAHCLCVYLSFNLLGLTVPENRVMKNFNVENWRERKMKKYRDE